MISIHQLSLLKYQLHIFKELYGIETQPLCLKWLNTKCFFRFPKISPKPWTSILRYYKQCSHWMRLMVNVHKLSFCIRWWKDSIHPLIASHLTRRLNKLFNPKRIIKLCTLSMHLCIQWKTRELWCCQYIAVIWEHEKCVKIHSKVLPFHSTFPFHPRINL